MSVAPLTKSRVEAFSDGVIAIIITIMVLELKTPDGFDLAALMSVAHIFLLYVLSFIYVGIYWNNHHHLMHAVSRINGGVLWANLHLLFWLSLIPFATAWMGENHNAPLPTALYGVSLLMPAIAWPLMQAAIIRSQGPDSPLRRALGADLKGKISPAVYLAGVGLSFVSPLIADLLYLAGALLWLVPDRRVEAALAGEGAGEGAQP